MKKKEKKFCIGQVVYTNTYFYPYRTKRQTLKIYNTYGVDAIKMGLRICKGVDNNSRFIWYKGFEEFGNGIIDEMNINDDWGI